MKKSLKTTLAFLLILVMGSTTAFGATFTDTGDHWAKDYISAWVEQGLISGYSDGSFRPDNAITRAEFMYIVNNAYGFNDTITSATINFSDAIASDWYYESLKIAVGAGYIKGYDDGTMKPNASITREEAAVAITKLNGLTADASKATGFKDSNTIEDWSKPYIGAVAEATFMKGDDLGYFNPTKKLTRAEAVVLLTKSAEAYVPAGPPPGSTITIDLPVTTDVAINSTSHIIRYTTNPAEAKVTATTDNELLTVAAFENKMTINTGAVAGVTRITLTMSKEGYETTEFVIDVNVLDAKAQKALNSDLSDLTNESISLFYQDESLSGVTGNMNLPTQGEKGSMIKWTSNNSEIIKITDGRATVTRPYYTDGKDAVVTLTATLSNNGYTGTKTFYATVLKAEPSDDITVTSTGYSIVASGANTVISSARQAVTESLTVKDFLANLTYHPYAEVKVVSEAVGKTVTSTAKFDSVDGKSASSKLTNGDYLVIKSENGARYKQYSIKTMLQVNAVTDFKWSGNGGLTWTKPATTYGYFIDIYKNGELVQEETAVANTTSLNILDSMKAKGVGTYTAVITNKGDLSRYAHSAGVETSTEQKITQLAAPSDLGWSGSTAVWEGDSRADSYQITLYKDSVVIKTITASTTKQDLSEYVQAGGDFKFRVTAVAGSGTLYLNSDISDSSVVISR